MKNQQSKILFIIVAILSLCFNTSCLADKGKKAVSNNNSSTVYNGRSYKLHIPNSLQNEKAPLLIALHGGLGNAEFIENALGMNQVADKKGFAVAYLNGTEGRLRMMKDKRTWNAGDCCGIAVKENIDDVSYIAGFINEIAKRYPVDTNRIYLMGHSNGAMMSYRFACEKPNMIAAMVSISGTLATNNCRNLDGLPILEIHGEQDTNVPVAGGVGDKSITKVNYRSVEQTGQGVKQAGASFNAKIIPGGGHAVADLNQAVRANYGISLAEMVANFFEGKSK
ncbi:MAG: phospholipase/Carboxylesterase [Rickettsiaceae bacterium]|jgi:poly(3-hydroxybutyrate) depolymerase|nr:phospholipase/Carboxylesterase [Rickettsiaceae bacterium]